MYELPRVKVGYGVVATSTLASAATVKPAVAPDNFQKIIAEKYSADIHFLINQANVRSSQTSKADYVDLNKRLMEASKASNQQIASLTVNSYASPEGSYEFNEQLARSVKRTRRLILRISSRRTKSRSSANLPLRSRRRTGKGSSSLSRTATFRTKTLSLSVLKMYKDPVQREQEIRNLSSVFNELADPRFCLSCVIPA